MHTDVATGHGEGVDVLVVDGEEGKTEAWVAAHGGQSVAELVQVHLDVGIVEVGRLPPANVVHDLLADLLFSAQRELTARHVTQFGQLVRRHRLNCQGQRESQGNESLGQTHGAMIAQP